MKRFHVHLSVKNLDNSVQFYNLIFGKQPDVLRNDYAKWMLEDPKVNFAITQLGHAPGLDHLGFQVESRKELEAMVDMLKNTDQAMTEENAAACCYARSDKGWVYDPQGIAWETFYSHGQSTTYGVDREKREDAAGACCAPGFCPSRASL